MFLSKSTHNFPHSIILTNWLLFSFSLPSFSVQLSEGVRYLFRTNQILHHFIRFVAALHRTIPSAAGTFNAIRKKLFETEWFLWFLFRAPWKRSITNYLSLSCCSFCIPILTHCSFETSSEILFQLVAACSCDIVVLFLFCVSGEIIIDSHDISDDVYNLFWYQFDAKSKLAVRLMIARTQKPYRFTSYETINCSLETYIIVWIWNRFCFLDPLFTQ